MYRFITRPTACARTQRRSRYAASVQVKKYAVAPTGKNTQVIQEEADKPLPLSKMTIGDILKEGKSLRAKNARLEREVDRLKKKLSTKNESAEELRKMKARTKTLQRLLGQVDAPAAKKATETTEAPKQVKPKAPSPPQGNTGNVIRSTTGNTARSAQSSQGRFQQSGRPGGHQRPGMGGRGPQGGAGKGKPVFS